jgi:flagellar protein FliJ
MTRHFALQNLLEVAVSEEESAAANLGERTRALQTQEQTLAMLLQYRADYQERLRRAAADGLDAAGLRNFNEFIGRLEQAIAQQRATLADARGHAEQSRARWQDKRRRSKAYDTLSQRAGAVQLRVDNLREQKQQDDFASRAARTKPSALR